jgi:hypothetical protein
MWLSVFGTTLHAQTLVLDSASFQHERRGDWKAVKLPDNWVTQGLEGKGSGSYRFTFNPNDLSTGSTNLLCAEPV